MESASVNTCRNCGNTYTGKYCNQCGEKLFSAHDKSIVYILEEVFHFLTHFEGSFFTTIKGIFSKPGKVSRDYSDGIRKKYYKPVSLFFLLIVVYLLFPGIFPQGLHMRMQYNEGQPVFGHVCHNMIANKIEKEHLTYQALEEKYDHECGTVSKGMLLILLPLTAFILMALNYRRGVFFDHFMLSTEINAFHLVFGFILMKAIIFLLAAIAIIIFRVDERALSQMDATEMGVMVIDTLVMVTFSFLAFRRFYQLSNLAAFIRAIIFWILFYFTVYILYKFLLFATVIVLI